MQIRSVIVVAALGLASFTHGQSAAVQWRVEDGGNGHWYRPVNQGSTVTWETARDAAVQQGAHLATLTGAAEAALVFSLVEGNQIYWQNSFGGPWLGGYQPDPSVPASAGWIWVTGEPWNYTKWAAGEPNDWGYAGGREHYLQFRDGSGGWNDFTNDGNFVRSFVIEWSADCDGNGIVDYGEILDGTLADTNANGVPDCCDAGVSCDPCPGDINASNTVDAEDLAYVLFAWGTDGGKTPEADITRDGIVDANDLSVVLGSWGPCPN